MKKIILILLALVALVLTSAAQDTSYRILSESDYSWVGISHSVHER